MDPDIAAFLYNILDYVDLLITLFQRTKLVLILYNNGIGQEIVQVMVQFCFPK